ncbi:MAG TPA: (d)CMP kinase [Firmicutes bacterium]|jgi:cytidylate kinase|nr:(d)CMP kinase [Bacillota bacterium]HAV20157.1 (d)CMP kinase [Bacillota bacterium]
MINRISIAIDGPAAAGKSTVAKLVAARLGFTYIDTGAMYRAFTYFVLKRGINPKDEQACDALIPEVHIQLKPGGVVLCNDEDVTHAIREVDVSSNVSDIASYKQIRLALVDQQRAMAKNSSVVMDGRDIGTYVLPDADIKIFQIASVETRAVRRYEENLSKNIACTLESVEEDLRRRDYIDSHRDFAPLKPAPDSILIDTSFMSVEEVVERIIDIIARKLSGLTK